jgi:hypothetical protein
MDPLKHAVGSILDSVLQRRAERSHPAVPFVIDKDHLAFAGIVGRSSVGIPVTVSNRDNVRLRVDARLEGAGSEFLLESTLEFIHPQSEQDGRATAQFPVRFTPTSPGSHEAVLVLVSDAGGETRVTLHGTATALEHASPKLDSAELANPLMPLSPVEEKGTPRQQRAHLDEALESLSRMAEQFNADRPSHDAAKDKASERMIAAVQHLNARVLRWLQSEGIHAMASSQDSPSGAAGLIKAFLMKGAELGLEHFFELGGAPLAAVMFALELGDLVRETAGERGEQREQVKAYTETMDHAFELGSKTQDVATSAVMHRFGGVIADYAGSRAEVRDIAGTQAMDVIADIQQMKDAAARGADTAYFYDKAREVVSRFRAAMQAWGAATGQMEVSAAVAETATTKGYDAMLDRYIEFRMQRALEEARPAPGALQFPEQIWNPDHELDTIVVDGGISFAEPVNIQLNSFRFGGYKDMSDEVRSHAAQMAIAEIEQPVELRLYVAEGGIITLHQHKQERRLSANGGAEAYVRRLGEERLWAAIHGTTIGPKVIKVA